MRTISTAIIGLAVHPELICTVNIASGDVA